MKRKVLIVGAGEIGSAISKILQKHDPMLWDRKPKLCTHGTNLQKLCEEASFVFLCIPSHAIDECADNIRGHISRNTIVISLTKGLERKDGQLTSELLKKRFGKSRIALLAGPMLAEELEMGLATKATLASTKKTFEAVNPLFKNTQLSLEHTTDIQGAAAAGVLKNVYALALGITHALELGDNAQGVIMHQAITEMQLLIKKLGGKPETALSLAGLGDLEATGNSDHSENRTTGKKLVASRKTKLMSEGSLSLPLLVKRVGASELPPLMKATKQVVLDRKDARKIFTKLLK